MKLLALSVALACLTAHAEASPACPTKAEARAKYPRAHIWHSGPNRCWSNRRGEFSRQASIEEPPPPVQTPVPNMWVIMPPTWDRAVWYPAGWEQELAPDTILMSTFEDDPPDVWP